MEEKKKERILALDVLRGLTVAGMILVNNPGSWGKIYAPLRHAEWNGLTPTDLVFPFFMFIMGVSMFISLKKYKFQPSVGTFQKILRRTIGIYFVGFLIGWFAHFCRYWHHADAELSFLGQLAEAAWNIPTMRITGVLARLAVCYGIAAVIAVCVKHKHLPYIIVSLLALYLLILLLGDGFNYGPDNVLSIVDRTILTEAHMYKDNGIDPEGLLSTIPSVAHVLIGFLVGRLLFGGEKGKPLPLLQLFIVGALLTFAGLLLQYGCPLNKKVWSPTFVLATCGMGSLLLGLLIYFIDIKGHRRGTSFFETFGVNPLFVFFVSDILAILLGSIRIPWEDSSITLHGLAYSNALVPIFGSYGGSLAFALLFIILNWAIAYPLYKKRIYIKL